MKATEKINLKIVASDEISKLVSQWRVLNKTIAFTNGCFDILHEGHLFSLSEAAKEADYLVVGLNSNESVTKLKGKGRPVVDERSRALLLASLVMVDAVVIFEEDTPLELIKKIRPDILVKGGDYKPEQVAGSKEVNEYGGKVIIKPILQGFSTTSLINKVSASNKN